MAEHLDRAQVARAVKALVTHIERVKAAKKRQLIEQVESIHIVLGLKKIPAQPKMKPIQIAIPHSLYEGDNVEICVFTKDPQKEFRALFAEKNIPGVAKVIGISKLRKNYRTHEDKRTLCGSYDLFMADKRIITMLPKLLGKEFWNKKKMPVAVDLRKNLVDEITRARNVTHLYLGKGSCLVVRIANADMSVSEIVDNILVGVENIVQHIPKKWCNIQSIHIKTPESIALPIYTALPDGPTDESVSDEAAAADNNEANEVDEAFNIEVGDEEDEETAQIPAQEETREETAKVENPTKEKVKPKTRSPERQVVRKKAAAKVGQ